MKKFIINGCMRYIRKNTDYDESKLNEIEYGLVGIYLTISKFIIITIISILIGIFKETLIFTLIYNILRVTSFGLHANKSWVCLITSILLFICIPYLSICLKIPIILKVTICVLGIIFMFKNSPADTKKRPIINKKKRELYKIISTLSVIIYSFIAITIKDNFMSNCIIFSIIVQNCMISPTVYKIFKLPYNNYISFLRDHPDFAQ